MDELALVITDASGEELSFSTTSDDPDKLVQITRIKTRRGVGFETCEFKIPRDAIRRYDDLDYLQKVGVYWPDGDCAFYGSITARAIDSGAVQFTASGDFQITKDRSGISEVYIDVSMERWGGFSLDRQAALLPTYAPTDAIIGGGGIKLQLAGIPWTNPGLPATGALYTAPPGVDLGSISASLLRTATEWDTANANFALYLGFSSDAATASDLSSDLAANVGTAYAASQSSSTSGRRFALMEASYGAAAATSDSKERAVKATSVKVKGTHGLDTITPSTVIKNIIDRWCPGITYDADSIQDHPYELEHLVFEEVEPAEAIARANGVANWWFEVWENGKAYYGPSPLLSEPDYLLDVEDGATLSPDNKSVDENYPVNGCEVFYTDALTGYREMVGPDDSSLLTSADDENPCNKQDRNRYLKVNIEYPCSANNAAQVGSVAFAEAIIPSRAGDGVVVGEVMTADGQMVPAGKIRAGKVARYLHEEAGREVFETDYEPMISKNSVKYDNNPATLGAILARIGIRVAGVGK